MKLEGPMELTPYSSIIFTPGMEAWQLETAAEHAECVILVTNALGSLPTNLHEIARKIVSSGKPIFILPDTPGENSGISAITQELQVKTLETGVTFLPKANVNSEPAVSSAIKEASTRGLRGIKLKEVIVAKFS